MSETPPSLTAWARTRGGGLLLRQVRAQLEAGRGGDRSAVAVTLDEPARADVGRLLGLAWEKSGQRVALGKLRAAIAAEGGELECLLSAIGGPLRDRPAERASERVARAERQDKARQLLLDAKVPPAAVEVALARRWLGSDGSEELIATIAQVTTLLAELGTRAPKGTLLAALASDLYDDPHALDHNRALGRAAARTLAADAAARGGLEGVELAAAAAASCASSAGWRATWAAAGVTCDEVSSTVLVLNLPLPGPSTASALLRAAAVVGEPVWLTARSLRETGSAGLPELAGLTVRVCENPAIVEAAATALGVRCPPLVCTYGRPSTGAWLLLDAVAGAGATVLVSGDRDVAGLEISRDLLARLPGSQAWLPEAPGLYEEDRLRFLLSDVETAALPE